VVTASVKPILRVTAMSPLDIAIQYIRRGWNTSPGAFRTKKAIDGWNTRQIEEDDAPRWFSGDAQNIAVVLGKTSKGLTDVDLDCPEALVLASWFLPATEAVFGRRSKVASHWLYYTDLADRVATATLTFSDPAKSGSGAMLVELRIGGASAYTVFPGSIHESGEPIEWGREGEPATVDGDMLRTAVKKLAAACLFARHWPDEGLRHAAALNLDGFLARCAWPKEERQHFLEAVATAAGDDEVRDRIRTGNLTEQKLAAGRRTPGFPKLCETFGDEVAKQAAEWLTNPVPQGDFLERMNDEYAVVQHGGKVRVLRFDLQNGRKIPTFLTFDDVCNYHKNEIMWTNDRPTSLGKWWTTHPKRRTYPGLTFRPNGGEVVDGRLNLWRGWGVQPAQGDWSLMRRHLEEVVAANDRDAAEYILNWLAWAVQFPTERAQVAVVIKGGRGTGKGTLGNAMCRLFGQHALQISSIEHLTGRFNAHLRDACFLFADEAYWPGDKKAEGTLKRIITEPTLFIEAKGLDGVTAPNMLHVLMASNSDWVVPAGEHERRFAVFQVSEVKRQDKDWFVSIYGQLDNGGYGAMLHDLLLLDLGDWHPRRIPMTEALRDQQVRSLEPLDAWIVELFDSGVLPPGADGPNRAPSHSKADFEGRDPRNGLFDLARQRVPALRHLDDQVLAAHLRRFGCTSWRSRDQRGWEFPPLAECRAKWEQKYPGWRWNHPETTDWFENHSPAFPAY
jgi:hypothetical protein